MTVRQPPVFVVVVNWNRWSDTIECLESVFRSSYPDTRVVLVDNGSTDGSVQRLLSWASGETAFAGAPEGPLKQLSWPPVEKPIPHLLWSEETADDARRRPLPRLTVIASDTNTGFARGNNLAMRVILASDDAAFVLLLNNDIVVAPDAIAQMVRSLGSDDRIAAMGGILFDYATPTKVQMAGGGLRTGLGLVDVFGAGLDREHVPPNRDLAFVGGGLLLIRTQTLRDVGLFDESFFVYGEDYDWGARMRKRGYRLAYTTDATVWHKGSVTVAKGSPFQDYHQVRGTLGFVRKHKLLLWPAAFAYSVVRSLLPKLARRQWNRAAAVLRAYRDHLLA